MKNEIFNHKKEILSVKYGKLFGLHLTIDIIEYNDFYVVKAEKFKLEMTSTNSNLNDAKKEFSDILALIIAKLLNNRTLFNVFSYLGIEQKSASQIIQEKNTEMQVHNLKNSNDKLFVNNDELMVNPYINTQRTEPTFSWDQ